MPQHRNSMGLISLRDVDDLSSAGGSVPGGVHRPNNPGAALPTTSIEPAAPVAPHSHQQMIQDELTQLNAAAQ